jgi:type III secretion apparatus protein, YscR/HrcR family
MQQYDPVVVVGVLLLLSIAPFVIMVSTSYLKIVVVLSLVRNALGVQQVPPTMVLNGLAIIFSVTIMAPVAFETMKYVDVNSLSRSMAPSEMVATVYNAKEPLQRFLEKHAHKDTVNFFYQTAKRLWPKEHAASLKPNDFSILLPAFTVSELTRAFEIGFLLYLPFVTIDIIISNILLAMGMMMVSPMTISLPFKLLLFVLLNGWSRLIQGLVLSYV